MARPICVKCQIEMDPLKNAFVVELMATDQPYQKYHADKFGCPICGIEVVTGRALAPVAEHWQKERYAAEPTDLRYWSTVKDRAKAVDAFNQQLQQLLKAAKEDGSLYEALRNPDAT